jgi:hypothetical protein
MAQNKLNKPKVKAFFNRFAFRAVPLALLFALPAFSQTPHTESYQLGMRIQEGIQKGDLSAFAKAFDAEALANRTLSQLKLPEPIKDHLRRGMQPRATAESVAESVANFGRNGSFVGVRRFQDEYHLLFRYVAERDSLAYYGFVIGEVQLSRVTLVDVYFFAPPGMLSDTIRRQCLLLLANVEKSQLENLEARQKDFIASQPDWTRFVALCAAGDNAGAAELFARLPATLRGEKLALFNRTRAAVGAGEEEFLATINSWRDLYPKDPSAEMFVSNYYWDKNQDSKALAAFGRLNDLLAGEPKLDLRMARLHLELNQPREAKVCLWQAARRDPPDAGAFIGLLQNTLAERNYEETARALTLQEAAFNVDLREKVKTEPTYEDFRKSPSYQTWLNQGRDQSKTALADTSTAAAPNSLTLQGVMFAGPKSSALISGKTVFVGDSVRGYKVIKIEPDRVTLQTTKGERRVLTSSRS